jgi:hypothetical protein
MMHRLLTAVDRKAGDETTVNSSGSFIAELKSNSPKFGESDLSLCFTGVALSFKKDLGVSVSWQRTI